MAPEFPDFLLQFTTFLNRRVKTVPDDAKVLTKALKTKEKRSNVFLSHYT